MNIKKIILISNSCFFLGLIFINTNQVEDLKSQDHFYHSNRYYDPKVSRFISPDSINPSPTKAQAFNRYAYVYNSPLKYRDPSGHIPVGGGLIDKIIDAFFGDRSRPPPPTYRGSASRYSYANSMNQRALDSRNLNRDVIKLTAGAAVAAHESEFKTGLAFAAGHAAGYKTLNPHTYTSQEAYSSKPFEPILATMDINLENEPLYQVPYYAGSAVPATMILIARFQTPARPRGLPEPPRVRPVQPRSAWPRPRRRRPPQYGEAGYPPVLVGGAPPPDVINWDDPYRYSEYPTGTVIHEYHNANLDNHIIDILTPQMEENGVLTRENIRITATHAIHGMPADVDTLKVKTPYEIHKLTVSFQEKVMAEATMRAGEYSVNGIVGDEGIFIPTTVKETLSYSVRY